MRFPLNSPFLAVFGPSLGFESLKFASQKWLLFLETKGSLIKFSKNMNFGEKVPEKPNQNVVSLTITAKKNIIRNIKVIKQNCPHGRVFSPNTNSLFFLF